MSKSHLVAAFGIVACLMCARAAAVAPSDLPLFVSTAASPNVMLMLDNSGSNNSIVWAGGFNPATHYTDWSFSCGSNGTSSCWTEDSSLLTFGSLPTGSCSGGRKRGRKSNGTVKCLKLPDPVGSGRTYYLGNYLNYLFETYPNNTDLTAAGTIPQTYRMQILKSVATNIVNDNAALRFGVFRFGTGSDNGNGGVLAQACGAATSSVISSINALDTGSGLTTTPLAETFYEVTRYFRGLTHYYADTSQTYTSPLQYRCQKNFVIVVTDGFPTLDGSFPSNDPADQADGAHSLPDWDGLHPSTTSAQYPNFPQYSDGFDTANANNTPVQEGKSLFLDDLVKFGYDLDLKTTGNDDAGGSWEEAAFDPQRLITYTIGLTTASQMLADAAQYGHGLYRTAGNEAELQTALQSAISSILDQTTSAAAVAANSSQLGTGTRIYQARFNPVGWTGQLLAYAVNSNGTVGAQQWDASTLLPAEGSRIIWTSNPAASAGSRGVGFSWANLTSTQQAALNRNALGTTDSLGSQRVTWLRGGTPSGVTFRNRSNRLGDIVNSDPYYAAQQDYGFSKLPGTEGSSYVTFRTQSSYTSRPAMLYVGANDGMLHAFDATTGVERFAFIPNSVYGNLSKLTDPAYGQDANHPHTWFVDGSPRVLDAYIGGGWKSVLVGTLGAGGKGVFALNVTDPANIGAGSVLWEFTNANDSDLGYTLPQASIVRLYNGGWGALVANGYDSTSRRAVLFVINLETGAILKEIDTGVGSVSEDNGLSTPVPVDVDNDRIVDFVYAGDLQGNLWKFDLTASNPNQWDVAFKSGSTNLPLFTACTDTDNCAATRQPITARPEAGQNPQGGVYVYFGTGRYFATGDGASTSTQSFYGIKDRNAKGASSPSPVGSGRGTLLQQTVLGVGSVTANGATEQFRVTSGNAGSGTEDGWYIDLPVSGERQISNPILRDGRVIFTTLVPNSDPCGFGGTSWIMELDALLGSRPSIPVLDTNGDGLFDSSDYVTAGGTSAPPSGRASTQGIIDAPRIVSSQTIEFKYASGSAGGIDVTRERTASNRGRQSWRQLFR